MLLKVRGCAGWNRPARCVGTPTEAHTRANTEAPFVDVSRKEDIEVRLLLLPVRWRLQCQKLKLRASPKSMGTSETDHRLLVVNRFVPIYENVFGYMQNPGPRQPNQYERYILHMPRQIGVHVHLRLCPPTSKEIIFFSVRSDRSVLPKKKKGCNGATLLFSLPRPYRYTVSLWLH